MQKFSDVALYEISIGKAPLTLEQEMLEVPSPNEEHIKLSCLLNQNLQVVEGNIHSCISLDINDHLFLVDPYHFYKFDFNTQTTKVYRNQNVVGLHIIDTKFCYTLSHSSKNHRSGLRLYDIGNILSKDNDVSYKLASM